MFSGCNLPKDFTLGDKFDTSNVIYMNSMFSDCNLPEGFTLGDKFVVSDNTNVFEMFKYAKMSNEFKAKYIELLSRVKLQKSLYMER